ncbi:penicillin-binding protein [Calidifontibacter sp. DB0510]|uniref:Penicillin-binding protein n=1 Tax=Metallococcus carri TaxID=1656884 RepID=A0A967B3G3_9MICO|nr:transglycosylase domain-containing protein [Metallococcus carri]NHN57279.1 penicillin-binding protein [Metallococcus carri]NOP38116.1 penicillin-binding protein [Calidifontibacter sp. DB2511S]
MTDRPTTSETAATPPAGGRTRRRRTRRRPLWVTVLLRAFLGFFLLFLIGAAAFIVIYLRTEVPQPNADANKQLSIIYYSDGKTELDRFSTVNREDVPLAKVPTTVQYEFLAAEDRNFYKNRGVSPTGIARAVWNGLTGKGEQGGSTITQQYVKNYFLTQDRTVTRKVKEIIISLKIDQKYSKQQILQDYLNNTYFGRNAYGIQAASKTYFNKDVSQLNPSEGAFLASIINAPGYYDPANGQAAEERTRYRMDYVLSGMVSQGWMTQAEKDRQTYPKVQGIKARKYAGGPNGYITAAVRSELKQKLRLTDEDIDRGGLRIVTTIDKNDQAAAVRAVNRNMPPQSPDKPVLNVGLVAQKPDGAVVAMYGGADYAKNQYSSATQASMQGGSSFKVFGLTAALENGFSLNSRFDGSSPLKLPGTKPLRNDQDEQFGNITLRTALAKSVNTSFLRLNVKMGPAKTRDAAVQLGIPATSGSLNGNVTNILGEASVRVADMANAFSTVGSGGNKADPYYIAKVSSVAGDYSYEAKPSTQPVLDGKVAADVANAMSGVLKPGGTAYNSVQGFTRPAGGKTGTTDGYKSAWFTGFTPNQLTTSVGMYAGTGTTAGTQSLAPAGASFYGGAVPAQIWADFMQNALKGEPVAKLPAPGNVNGGGAEPTSVAPPPTTTTTTPSSTSTPSSSTSTSTSSTTSTSTSTPTSSSPTSTSSTTTPSSTATPTLTSTAPPPATSTRPPSAPTTTPSPPAARSTPTAPSLPVPTG